MLSGRGRRESARIGRPVPAKVVSERLGHSSVTLTLALYSHVMQAVEGEHADAVATLIGRNRRKLL